MQHVRLQCALILLSMVLPSSFLTAGSFENFPHEPVNNPLDKSKNQDNDADHHSDLLSEQSSAPESGQDTTKEQTLPVAAHTSLPKNEVPRVEDLVKNSADAVLQKFMIKHTRKKDLDVAIVADNKAGNEYEAIFKKSLKGDTTKQSLLTAMHNIAVKQNGDTEIALALSQVMYDVKTKKRFYNDLTGREQVALATGVVGTSAVAALITYRNEILQGIKTVAGMIAGTQAAS